MIDTPLLIGVTGHRDLTDESYQMAKNQVHSFLTNLQERIPNTPIRLMSGLADGADRLVARAALELGISVQAVLPMPVEMYEKDFSNESLQEFKKLIENDNVELLELSVPTDIDSSKAEAFGPERDALYAQLGEHLIQNSSILIALWDGSNNDLTGGTSDVVLRYLDAGGSGNDAAVNFLDNVDVQAVGSEFVFWVPVKRISNDNISEVPVATNPLFVTGNLGPNTLRIQESMPDDLKLQIERLNSYNNDYTEIVDQGKFFTWGGMLDKLPDAKTHSEYPMLKALDDEYQKADGLALFNQKYSDRQFKLFGYMAALMGLLFLFYAKILAAKVFLIGYLALFLAGLWMFRITDKKHWFSRHLMQRVIAETLRVRFYLILAGIDRQVDVDKMLDLTGVSQFSGFSWIKQVFRSHQSLASEVKPEEVQQRDIEFVCKEWLDDQAGYFKSKIEKLSLHHHKLEKIKNKLLITSAIAVVLLIFFKKYLVGVNIAGSLDLKTLLVFFMGLLPFWLGVWEIYQSKMAVKELLWQYRNQSNLFNLARLQIANSKTIEQKRKILTSLGQKSLMENYLWTIHRYHREHEPPTAG